MIDEEKLPWFSPDESIEAIELIEELASRLMWMAEFAPLRKDIRLQIEQKAREVQEFAKRANRPAVERSVLLALDAIAEKRKVKNAVLLQEAVEAFVSKVNRSEK